MATYYVDHAGSNTAPYDTQAKAAPALATILAIPPAAGDIIYCCDNAGAGETIAAELDLASSGTNAEGWIKLIGCNSSGVVDGTRYVIDGGGNGIHILDFNGQDMWWFENIEATNTGAGAKYGFYSSATVSMGHVLINCCAHDCGAQGYRSTNLSYTHFIRCIAYANTGSGFYSDGGRCRYLFCCARDNGVRGWESVSDTAILIGCIAHGNANDGIGLNPGAFIFNCVIDGNADDGIVLAASTSLFAAAIFGCRITNHSGAGDIGLDAASEPCITGWNYFEDNDGANIQNAEVHSPIPLEGGSTTSNLEDLANTNAGYVSETGGSEDFATNYVDAGDPDLRRTPITVPWV